MNEMIEKVNQTSEKSRSNARLQPVILSLKETDHCDCIIRTLEDLSVMDDLLSKQNVVHVTLIEDVDDPSSIFSKTIIHLCKNYDIHDADNQVNDNRGRMKRLYLNLLFETNAKGET